MSGGGGMSGKGGGGPGASGTNGGEPGTSGTNGGPPGTTGTNGGERGTTGTSGTTGTNGKNGTRGMLRRIYAQMMKELSQFRRDKLSVGLAFFLPVVALVMYGFATRLESKNMPIAIADFDNGVMSRKYFDVLFASQQLKPRRSAVGDPLRPIDMGDVKASVVIPPDFDRRLKSGKEAHVQVIVDATDVNNARIIKNSIIALTNFFTSTADLPQAVPLIQPSLRLWFNPGRLEALHIVPGSMALVLWVFPALLSALAMAREKEQGTILQIYASNLTAFEFVSGKALAYLIVGIGEAALLIVFSLLAFNITFAASILPYLGATVLFVLTAVLFGLLAASRADTQMAAVQLVANLGFLATMLLSGFIYPVRNIVYPLSLLSYVVPARYFIEVSRNAYVRGGSWLDLWYVPVMLIVLNVWFLLVASRIRMKLRG